MIKDLDFIISPKKAQDNEEIRNSLARKLGVSNSDINHFIVLRRSVDARQRPVQLNLRIRAYIGEDYEEQESVEFNYQDVSQAKEVIVVGAGPAGLFAALRLIELGLKPIVIERGKPVSERKLDIANINRNKGIDPNSNFCFGEGGAGTFSDGKLYSRSKKRNVVHPMLLVRVNLNSHWRVS